MSSVLVLNVDDYAVARYAITRLLLNAGFFVEEASNGLEALQLIEAKKPELILLDVRLPDIDGLDVCRQIKANLATRSCLVVQISSAFIAPEDVASGLASGADAYVTAPYTPQDLVELLRSLTAKVHLLPIQ